MMADAGWVLMVSQSSNAQMYWYPHRPEVAIIPATGGISRPVTDAYPDWLGLYCAGELKCFAGQAVDFFGKGWTPLGIVSETMRATFEFFRLRLKNERFNHAINYLWWPVSFMRFLHAHTSSKKGFFPCWIFRCSITGCSGYRLHPSRLWYQ